MRPRPSSIGSYRLVRLLGEGGMGSVYLAEPEGAGPRVALKTVQVPDEAMLPRLRREIWALSRIRHPGIVQIVDSGIHEGLPWYAMELIAGSTLRNWAQAVRSVAPESAVQPGDGLHAATASASFRPRPAEAQRIPTATHREATAVNSNLAEPVMAQLPEPPPPPGRLELSLETLWAILTLVRRLCASLAYLHGEGIVHRDLKPDNVLVTGSRKWAGDSREAQHASHPTAYSLLPTPFPAQNAAHPTAYSLLPAPFPVIVDFGLMTHSGGQLSRESLDVETGTSGTARYMAPEQIRGQLLDARTDLYALGCILYEMLAGRPPFVGRTVAEIFAAHLQRTAPPPSQLVSGIPPALDELVLRLLAKEPRERLGHAADVATRLEALGAEDGLTQAGPAPRAYLYRPGLAGRNELLQRIDAYLEKLASGRGGMLWIGGESGVGKTRLVLEIARIAERRFLRVLAGECVPAAGLQGGGAPLGALGRPLQAIADRCRERGPEETQRLLGPRAKLLLRYEPALQGLPGLELVAEPPELPAEAARPRLFQALLETFAALAAGEPLLLVLDDLQWADELTVGFLQFLADTPEASHRLLVLGTYRSEEVGAHRDTRLRRLIEEPGAGCLELDRLDEEAVGAMVGDMLALAPPPQLFARVLARHSEGNPFFVAEYLRAAVGEGVLYRDAAGRWEVQVQGEATEAAYESLPLPWAIQDLVGRRLDGLEPTARSLAEAAAVVGRQLDAQILQDMLSAAEEEALEPLRELLARQILRETDAGGLRFVHDKIREVAYRQIDAARRQELHRAAAASVEVRHGTERYEHLAAIGHHWEQGGRPLLAARYLAEAGQRAAASYAAQEGIEALDRAIPVLEDASSDPENLRALLRALDARSRLRDQLGRFVEAEQDACRLAELARLVGDDVHLGRAFFQWGHARYNLGEYDEALRRYEESLSVLAGAGSPEDLSSTRREIGWIHSSRGEYGAAESHFQAALATPGLAIQSTARLECLMQSAATLQLRGQLQEAMENFQQLLPQYRARGDIFNEARCKAQMALVRRDLGDRPQAIRLIEEARDVFRRLRAVQFYLLHSMNFGLLLGDEGAFARATQVFRDMELAAEGCGERFLAAMARTHQSWYELRRGAIAASLELSGAAAQVFEGLRERKWLSYGLRCQAQAHAVAGDHSASDCAFERALRLAEELNAPLETGKVYANWLHAIIERRGDVGLAWPLLDAAVKTLPRERYPAQAVEIRLLGDLLEVLGSAPEAQPRAWERFWAGLAELEQTRGVHPDSMQRILLAGAEIAVLQRRCESAEDLVTHYRRISSPEHLLHELRALLVEYGLAAERRSTADAQQLLHLARANVHRLLGDFSHSARTTAEHAPLIRRILDLDP